MKVITLKKVWNIAANNDKLSVVKKYKIDSHIDDAPFEIDCLSKPISVICYDAYYYKDCMGENIFRAKTREEIYDMLQDEKISLRSANK